MLPQVLSHAECIICDNIAGQAAYGMDSKDVSHALICQENAPNLSCLSCQLDNMLRQVDKVLSHAECKMFC